jgi:hypothetical protein
MLITATPDNGGTYAEVAHEAVFRVDFQRADSIFSGSCSRRTGDWAPFRIWVQSVYRYAELPFAAANGIRIAK